MSRIRVITLILALAIFLLSCSKASPDAQLLKAAALGDTTRAEKLLHRGVGVDVRDNEGRTPLMHAAYEGHVSTVGLLLENGADPNMRDDDGRPVLYCAIAPISITVTRSGNHASTYSRVEIARLLIEKGADVNAQHFGQPILMTAVEIRHHSELEETYQMVKLLIENDADVNAVDSDGCRALDLADDPEIIKLLQDAGAVHGEKECTGRIYT